LNEQNDDIMMNDDYDDVVGVLICLRYGYEFIGFFLGKNLKLSHQAKYNLAFPNPNPNPKLNQNKKSI